jgi:hypothetical protein
MSDNANLIPGLSLLDHEIVANVLQVNGYACLAKWDWEQQKGRDNKQHISEFRTEWKVPNPPVSHSKQTIFLFNGMQPSARNLTAKAILQPVLQWGNPGAGGGPFWSVASWYVKVKMDDEKMKLDTVARTKPIPVNPGDILTGLITQTKALDEDFYTCVCEFAGITGTSLIVQTADELVQNGLALEAYKLDKCDEWPSENYTSYENIVIKTSDSGTSPAWDVINNVFDCNIRAEAVAHNGVEDQINIYYK